MEKVILDFSGLSEEEGLRAAVRDAVYLDFCGMEGTNCYCDADACSRIRNALRDLPAYAIHLIDTGDYHYLSRFWMEKVAAENSGSPFALILFDNHPDMQEPAFDGMLSCGGWARDAFAGIDGVGQVLLVGIDPDLEIEILDLVFDGVLAVTSDDFKHTGDAVGTDVQEMLSLLDPGIPVYVSIDIDVLSKTYASTNWNQGTMSLKQLETVLETIAASHRILGADICGGLTREKGAVDADLELNLKTRLELLSYVDNLVER